MKAGMLECVPESLTLKQILDDYSDVGRFIAKQGTTDASRAEMQTTFIKSCGTIVREF